MMCLSEVQHAGFIEALISRSQRLDIWMNCYSSYILLIDTYIDGVVNHIYPSKFQLDTVNSSDTKVSFLDLHLRLLECQIMLLT